MALFQKGLLDFRSAAQKKEDYRQFQLCVLPLGDGQKEKAAAVLAAAPKKAPPERLMFLFLVAKERYLETERAEKTQAECRKESLHYLGRFHLTSRENLAYVFCLALLDMQTESLDDYPTADQVYDLMNKLFPVKFSSPNWDALS